MNTRKKPSRRRDHGEPYNPQLRMAGIIAQLVDLGEFLQYDLDAARAQDLSATPVTQIRRWHQGTGAVCEPAREGDPFDACLVLPNLRPLTAAAYQSFVWVRAFHRLKGTGAQFDPAVLFVHAERGGGPFVVLTWPAWAEILRQLQRS